MKIAFVLLGESSVGGADKRFANLFNYLIINDHTHSFYFIISRNKYESIRKTVQNFSHRNIIIIENRVKKSVPGSKPGGMVVAGSRAYKYPKWIKRLLSLIIIWVELIKNSWGLYCIVRKYKIDILHTLWKGAFAAAFLKLFYKKPFHVLTYMDVYCERISKKIIDIPISYALSLKNADHIDFLGSTYLEELQKNGFTFCNEKISVSPCSFIDTSSFSMNTFSEKENLVIFASRLVPKKNPFLFIEIAEQILNKREDINFEIHGRGDLESEIKYRLKTKGMEGKIKIVFSENMSEVFARSKILLSLQDIENYPSQSVLEAMYYRNIVIASNTGETGKLVTSDTGFLTSSDPNSITDKIEFVIDNPEYTRDMASNAHEFVMINHRIEIFAKYILDIYSHFEQAQHN